MRGEKRTTNKIKKFVSLKNNQMRCHWECQISVLLKISLLKTYVHLSVFYCLLLNIPLDLLEFCTKAGILNPAPGELSSCRFQFQPCSNSPVWNEQVALKTLFSWFRCVWLVLELKSEVRYLSRSRVGDPALRQYIFKPVTGFHCSIVTVTHLLLKLQSFF